MSDGPHDYGLVMPFVPVKSRGGPYDDNSYVAGYEMGLLDARLPLLGDWVVQCRFTIHKENLEQADLIAMRHGFSVTPVAPDDFPDWVWITLPRGESA